MSNQATPPPPSAAATDAPPSTTTTSPAAAPNAAASSSKHPSSASSSGGGGGGRERIGDYILGSEIGKGSFAIVYKGYRSASAGASSSSAGSRRSPVAIKAVSRNKLTPKLLENLEGEISILKAISHENVVRLEDCIKNDHHIYLIMAYCSGGDLSVYIKRRGRLPTLEFRPLPGDPLYTSSYKGPSSDLVFWPHPEEGGLDDRVTRCFLGQLAEALRFLRERDLIHRDIKPQNLLLHPPDEAAYAAGHPHGIPLLKVADFGFARILPAATLAETLCGSPLYMAPEILRYEKYDAKADLWSVGAVLFEMAVGRPPFRAQNHVELLRKIEKGEDRIRFPDEQRPNSAEEAAAAPVKSLPVPEDIKELIRRLLKRQPVPRMSFEDFFTSRVWEGYVRPPPARPRSNSSRGSPPSRSGRPREPLQRKEDNQALSQSSGAAVTSASVAGSAASSSHLRPTRPAPSPTGVDHQQRRTSGSNRPPSEPKYFVSAAKQSPVKTTQTQSRPTLTSSPPPPGNQVIQRATPANTISTDPGASAEYVMIEKRTVEVNALADELGAAARRPDGLGRRRSSRTSHSSALAQRPAITGSALSYSPPFALSSTPPLGGPSRQVVSSPLSGGINNNLTTYGGGMTYHQAAQEAQARYGGSGGTDSPSGLARALTSAGMRLFAPVNALGSLSRRPWARQTASPSAPLRIGGIGDVDSDPEEESLLVELDDVAHKAHVLCEFADAKLNQCVYSRSPSQQQATTSQTRRRSSSASSSEMGIKVETLCAEALVLYLKSLAFLQHGVERAKGYWDLKAGGGSAAGTSADLNDTIQWFRTRFNDCFDKAEWAKTRCSDEIPDSASFVEKLVYDRAIEISRSAAVNELVGEDLAASEIGYENALWLLFAVMDPTLHDGVEISETDRLMIEKVVGSIKTRLASLRQKMLGNI